MLDRFSGHADSYARYRIDYPDALYSYILSFVNDRKAAWDCATGNGQVASALATYFDQVVATDITVERYWTVEWFLNYIRTWSAVRKFIVANGYDPVDTLAEQVSRIWGPGQRLVHFPVFLRLGRNR